MQELWAGQKAAAAPATQDARAALLPTPAFPRGLHATGFATLGLQPQVRARESHETTLQEKARRGVTDQTLAATAAPPKAAVDTLEEVQEPNRWPLWQWPLSLHLNPLQLTRRIAF